MLGKARAPSLLTAQNNREMPHDVWYGALRHVKLRIQLPYQPLANGYGEQRRRNVALHQHAVLLHGEHHLAEHVRGVDGQLGVKPRRAHELVHDLLNVCLEGCHIELVRDGRLVESLQVVDDLVCVAGAEGVQELREGPEGLSVQRRGDARIEHGYMVVLLRVEDVTTMQVAVNEVVANHHLHAHVVEDIAQSFLHSPMLLF
mmetsp:Transcript_40955/g.117664  ORF Transcript_40955/g.117664 Transcript_40955/m.117664 type:complete len:202 (+) Transcript_40955:92-697(+)